jgi:hypothetical protein
MKTICLLAWQLSMLTSLACADANVEGPGEPNDVVTTISDRRLPSAQLRIAI